MKRIKHSEDSSRKKAILTFLLCFGMALGLAWLLTEPDFSQSQRSVLFILFFAIGLWFTEVIPPFAVSLLVVSFLVFALGDKNFNSSPVKVDIYVNTFSSSIIWLLLGGFFMALGMTKTKLDQELLKFTFRVSGNKPRNLVIGLMATTMIASMLMSNTATTAMVIASLTPLLNKLGKEAGLSKALLLGVPISAGTGGMATIIGTPPNALAAGALENTGIKIDFLTWMLYGTPVSLVLNVIACAVLIFIYVKDNTPLALDFLENKSEELTRELKIQRKIVIAVISVTVLLWLTGGLHGISVAAISAVPLVCLTLTKVLKGNDVRTMPWDTLLLVAGGLSLGLALQKTGLLDHYVTRISHLSITQISFLFLFAFITMLFSNIMSHTATSTVMIPLGMAVMTSMQTEVAMIIALAASTALFLPVSTPPNAIAFSTGLIEQKDFRLGGILIGILGPALIVLWVLFVTALINR